MKIAILFFGQPRFVENRLVSKKLHRKFSQYDVEYFGHTWIDEKGSNLSTSPWSGLKSLTSSGFALDAIEQQYPGIKIKSEKSLFFSLDEDAQLISSGLPINLNAELLKKFSELECLNLNNTLSQFYSINSVIKLFEGSTDTSIYDLVILTRFDCYIVTLPELFSFTRTNQLIVSGKHDNYPDLLILGSLTAIKSSDVLPNLQKLFNSLQSLNGEFMREANLKSNFSNIQVKKIKFYHYCIRHKSRLKAILLIWVEVFRENVSHNKNLRVKLSKFKQKIVGFSIE